MKKLFVILVILIAFPAEQLAFHLNIGILYGPRTVFDSEIRTVYGSGTVFYPYLSIEIWKGLTIGAGYEGGYSKSGNIGIYEEQSSLKVTGFDLFVGYELKVKITSLYMKVGYGIFSYEQIVNSPYVVDYKVDHKKTTISIGGGIKIFLIKNFCLVGEIRYVPLKVKPYEQQVDLGGIRYLAGFGLTI